MTGLVVTVRSIVHDATLPTARRILFIHVHKESYRRVEPMRLNWKT